jgi:signal transduction histidine kinase
MAGKQDTPSAPVLSGGAEEAVAGERLRVALARAERLQRAGAALSRTLTAQEVLEAVLATDNADEAGAGALVILSDDGRWLELAASRGLASEWTGARRRLPADSSDPIADAVRTGRAVYLGSAAEQAARYPALEPIPGVALAALPLLLADEARGCLLFVFGCEQEFGHDRRDVKRVLARMASQALDRARSFAAEQSARQRLSLLSEASAALGSSLDYEQVPNRLTGLAVPALAHWCAVDLFDEEGTLTRTAIAQEHADNGDIYSQVISGTGISEALAPVLESGQAQLAPDSAAEPDASSWMIVPLVVRTRTIGALSLLRLCPGRPYTPADLELAEELARRAAIAIDNASLFREIERRADAARALDNVGEAVVLLDRRGIVRYWNRAAATITGATTEVLGQQLAEALPAWQSVLEHVPVAETSTAEAARPATVPIEIDDEDRWYSTLAISFEEGTVFTLRDVTAEQRLERARHDFVATASHELRTPLAAVYGAVRTLRRTDIEIKPDQQELLLSMIESETERLRTIVDGLILAGQIDAGELRIAKQICDLIALAENVVALEQLRVPASISLAIDAHPKLPPILCDEDKLRQVLLNLVENAIKYSPEGGRIAIGISTTSTHARLTVSDQGLGIPITEKERIFEKFYRLDPALTRGVGGNGLGLYIARELVKRMGGSLTVQSVPDEGSTFTIQLPTGRESKNDQQPIAAGPTP